jgi:hypothetical protein
MFKPFEKQIGTMKIEQRAGRERLALRLDRSPFSFQVVMLVKTTPANDRCLKNWSSRHRHIHQQLSELSGKMAHFKIVGCADCPLFALAERSTFDNDS